MGSGTSQTPTPSTEQKNNAKANERRTASAPAGMMKLPNKSAHVSDSLLPTDSSYQVSPTFDDEVNALLETKTNENASRDLHERSNDVPGPGNKVPRPYGPIKARTGDPSGSENKSVVKTSTFNVETPRPRRGHEDPRIVPVNNPVKAWPDDLSGSENKHVSDLPNRDRKKPSKKKKKKKSPPLETRDTDDRKTEESNENHAASSSNDMNIVHEYERNVKRLESRVSQLSAEKDGLLNREDDDIKTEESNENHAASSSNDMNIVHEYERNVKRLESRVSQLSAEKDGLLNRLSEIGALKLTEHNPNVTDLGDPNRAEKVVDELSEIYDNEWTDAYEYLTKKRKENTDVSVKTLLMILKDVFTICMSSTEKKTKALEKALVSYVGLTEEDQDELDLKDIEKRIRDYRRKKLQKNFNSIEEEVGKQLKTILTEETFDDLSQYIGSCVRICWKLCTKEPPMHLDFGDSKQPAPSSHKTATKTHFDKDIFRCYTQSGNYLDYVVWPAVYLYKDGPLMRKGVAQGVQENKEYKDEEDKPA